MVNLPTVMKALGIATAASLLVTLILDFLIDGMAGWKPLILLVITFFATIAMMRQWPQLGIGKMISLMFALGMGAGIVICFTVQSPLR